MALLLLYLLTFIIFGIITYYNKDFRTVTKFLLVFQFLIFLIPIKRFLLSITRQGISVDSLLLLLLFPILTYLFILWSRKRTSRFKEFLEKLLVKVKKEIDQLAFFNQHTLFLTNKYLPKIEELFRPFLIKDPYKFLLYLTFFSSTFLFSIVVVEYTISKKIKIVWIFLIISMFLFRLLQVALDYIMEISFNSVNYHFNRILFMTYLPPKQKGEKENLFRLLDITNLECMFFSDRIYAKFHLLNKFFIIKSIVHFSSMYFIAYAFKRYLLFHTRFLSNFHLFSLVFTLLVIDRFFHFISSDLLKLFFVIDLFLFHSILHIYCYQEYILNRRFFKVQNLLNKLTKTIPVFLNGAFSLYVKEKFVTKQEILAIQPFGIYFGTVQKKPSFVEGFYEIPFFDNPSEGFLWKKYSKVLAFFCFTVISYFLIDYFIDFFNLYRLPEFLFLLLTLLKESLITIFWLILMLFK